MTNVTIDIQITVYSEQKLGGKRLHIETWFRNKEIRRPLIVSPIWRGAFSFSFRERTLFRNRMEAICKPFADRLHLGKMRKSRNDGRKWRVKLGIIVNECSTNAMQIVNFRVSVIAIICSNQSNSDNRNSTLRSFTFTASRALASISLNYNYFYRIMRDFIWSRHVDKNGLRSRDNAGRRSVPSAPAPLSPWIDIAERKPVVTLFTYWLKEKVVRNIVA